MFESKQRQNRLLVRNYIELEPNQKDNNVGGFPNNRPEHEPLHRIIFSRPINFKDKQGAEGRKE